LPLASYLALRVGGRALLLRRQVRSMPSQRQIAAQIPVKNILSHENDTNDDFLETNIDFCCCFSFFIEIFIGFVSDS